MQEEQHTLKTNDQSNTVSDAVTDCIRSGAADEALHDRRMSFHHVFVLLVATLNRGIVLDQSL